MQPLEIDGIRPSVDRNARRHDEMVAILVTGVRVDLVQYAILEIADNVLLAEFRVIGGTPSQLLVRNALVPLSGREIVDPCESGRRKNIEDVPAPLVDKSFNRQFLHRAQGIDGALDC